MIRVPDLRDADDDGDTDGEVTATVPRMRVRAEAEVEAEAWLALDRNKSGKPRPTLANVLTVLSLHPDWAGVIARDLFSDRTLKLKPAPARAEDAPPDAEPGDWGATDSSRTAAWLSAAAELDVSTTLVDQAVEVIAERNAYHPVRDYLSALRWDGVPRITTWLAVHFGAASNRYTQAIGARWLISAVARVMRPGCQADCMLILEAGQGIGKSTGVAVLAGDDWFADTGLAIGDKDSYQALRGKWIYECPELDSLKGREPSRLKAFVGARVDNYRPSYERRNRDFPRQCVFVGTTNESAYLSDTTGNRRFWPVRCADRDVDRDAIRAVRDQLWAEAVVWYQDGKAWHADTPELRALCEREQDDRRELDPWEACARSWAHARIDRGLTTAELLRDGLGLEPAQITRREETRAGRVLRSLGFGDVRQEREGADRIRKYHWEAPNDA